MYIAIIADIVNSRNIHNRSDVQDKLNHLLERLNEAYKTSLASGFTITIGDEFQGLLESPNDLLEIIHLIKLEMYPVELRFGVGIGSITTALKPLAIGADGPAYYAARKAIESIKSSDKRYEQPDREIMIVASGKERQTLDKLRTINTLLVNCSFIEQGWTDKQREIIYQLQTEDLTQRELAERNKLRQSSVQRRISTSGYYTYRYTKEEANHLLKSLWEDINES